jgi:hypothetical protein
MRPYLEKPFRKIGLVEWLKVKALSSRPVLQKKKKKWLEHFWHHCSVMIPRCQFRCLLNHLMPVLQARPFLFLEVVVTGRAGESLRESSVSDVFPATWKVP